MQDKGSLSRRKGLKMKMHFIMAWKELKRLMKEREMRELRLDEDCRERERERDNNTNKLVLKAFAFLTEFIN